MASVSVSGCLFGEQSQGSCVFRRGCRSKHSHSICGQCSPHSPKPSASCVDADGMGIGTGFNAYCAMLLYTLYNFRLQFENFFANSWHLYRHRSTGNATFRQKIPFSAILLL